MYEGGNNLGRRASLCETVLGLVPGRFSEPPDSRVMVAGLVPGSHALRNGAIKIGEWLGQGCWCKSSSFKYFLNQDIFLQTKVDKLEI